MRNITNTFLTGLFTLLPLAITLYLIVWVARWVEAILGGWVTMVLPDAFSFPGLGFLISIGLIFLTGLLMKAWLIRRVFSSFEDLLVQIPFFNFIYKPMKEVLALFANNKQNESKKTSRVVFVKLPQSPFKLMGLVMREKLQGVPTDPDAIAIYFPMSYQLGGFTVFVPKQYVEETNLKMEEAMKLALTAWIQTGSKQ